MKIVGKDIVGVRKNSPWARYPTVLSANRNRYLIEMPIRDIGQTLVNSLPHPMIIADKIIYDIAWGVK